MQRRVQTIPNLGRAESTKPAFRAPGRDLSHPGLDRAGMVSNPPTRYEPDQQGFARVTAALSSAHGISVRRQKRCRAGSGSSDAPVQPQTPSGNHRVNSRGGGGIAGKRCPHRAGPARDRPPPRLRQRRERLTHLGPSGTPQSCPRSRCALPAARRPAPGRFRRLRFGEQNVEPMAPAPA